MRLARRVNGMNRNSWAALLATIAVVLALVLGFRFLGGPGSQRLVRADQRTLQTLAELAQQINSRWQSGGKTLPANLDKFPESAQKNPATGAKFIYRVKSSSDYELCADFFTDNRNMGDVGTADLWLHPQGAHCFSFDAGQSVTVPWVPYH